MGGKKILLVGGFLAIFILIASGVIFFFFGFQTLWSIVKTLGMAVIVLVVLAVLGFLFWFLFIKKQKFDVTAVNKKKLILAGKIQCPKSIHGRKLRLSGDRGHSWFTFGKIKGYLRIQILLRTTKTDQNGNIIQDEDSYGRKIPQYELDTEEQDVFIIQRGIFPITLFTEEDVVRVHPKDHDELIGDVTLFGLNLVPISEFWYLASDYLDVRKLDRSILGEAWRGVMFEMLKDAKSIVDASIDLDSKHRKIIEEKSLMEIPQLQQLGQK